MPANPARILLAEMSRTRHEGPAQSALHLLAHADPARFLFTPVFSFPLEELPERDRPDGALRVPMPRPTWRSGPAQAARFAGQVLAASGALADIARNERIALIHANSLVNLHAVLAARRARVPLMLSAREILDPRRANRAYAQLACGAAAAVHAVSDAVRGSLLELGVAEKKIRVVRNGMDIPEVTDAQKQQASRELGIPPDAPAICIVGTITELKGHHVLVRAMGEVLKELPDARLVVVGEPQADSEDYGKRLRAEAAQPPLAGRVAFAGRRDDVSAILASCAVHAQPSVRPDSLPRTVLEAMAAGVPSIGSDIGGIPEMIVHGQTGLVVPPGDGHALARGLISLLADEKLRARMGEAARERARTLFSPAAHAREIMDIYSSVLRRGSL